jgi:ornithine decarboxylase
MLDTVASRKEPPVFKRSQINTHLKEQGYGGPFLILDSSIIRTKAQQFMQALPRVHPHFAVKSNPDIRVLTILKEEGVSFEIASKVELDSLLALGVRAEEIFYSNPIKSRRYCEYAASKGVQWFVVDSEEELRKIYQIKPDARIYLRIYTTNEGSGWPLSSKFGARESQTQIIIETAATLGADLAGVTFHVGSQCQNINNWRVGIRTAAKVFEQMRNVGLNPRLLNLGGGYPVELVGPVPSIEEIADVINDELVAFPPSTKIIAEPGRFLVADAGYFVSQVVGKTTREDKHWLYLDSGFYGGLLELKDGLDYELYCDRHGALVSWIIAGPTCDSIDVVMESQPLPCDMQEDDFIYIKNAGAYSSACACTFNGFPMPEVFVV